MVCRLYIVAALILLAVPPLYGQSFGTEPLRSPIAFPADSLPNTWPALRDWLETSLPTLSSADLPRVREHLYALISADAKSRVAEGRTPFPVHGDSALAQMFGWADRLGTVGADLVAARLQGRIAPSLGSSAAVAGFMVSFDSLYSVAAIQDGWAIRFPHYFMIGSVTRQTLANGIESSVLVLSTLFAKDSTTHPGASQATILIVSGEASAPDMAAFWLAQLGLSPTDTVPPPTPSVVRAYRGSENAARLTKEMAVVAPAGRTIVVIFVGLDGTYETNRQHFVDLLNTLRVRPGRSHD